jgi:hypothetical protein
VPFHLISFRVFTGHILASNVKNHHPAAH